MTITISNPPRGCGRKKKGGCYLEAEMGAGGDLAPATWALDWGIAEEPLLSIAVPPRGVHLFDPQASFAARLIHPPWSGHIAPAAELAHLAGLGRCALLDHVGGDYTPWAFVKELEACGPSRRVPAAIAKQIAGLCPIPIFFCASLPLFNRRAGAERFWEGLQAAGAVSEPFDRRRQEPTWEHPAWSIRVRDYPGGPRRERYDGRDHYLVEVLRAHDRMQEAERREAFEHTAEQLFTASVITRCVYVLRDGETELPDDLQDSGVLPGTLAE